MKGLCALFQSSTPWQSAQEAPFEVPICNSFEIDTEAIVRMGPAIYSVGMSVYIVWCQIRAFFFSIWRGSESNDLFQKMVRWMFQQCAILIWAKAMAEYVYRLMQSWPRYLFGKRQRLYPVPTCLQLLAQLRPLLVSLVVNDAFLEAIPDGVQCTIGIKFLMLLFQAGLGCVFVLSGAFLLRMRLDEHCRNVGFCRTVVRTRRNRNLTKRPKINWVGIFLLTQICGAQVNPWIAESALRYLDDGLEQQVANQSLRQEETHDSFRSYGNHDEIGHRKTDKEDQIQGQNPMQFCSQDKEDICLVLDATVPFCEYWRDQNSFVCPHFEGEDTEKLVEDTVAYMQVGLRSDPFGSYIRAINPDIDVRITTWLHTWDRRNQWSYLHRVVHVDVTRDIRTQILRFWQDHQVRSSAIVTAIRPLPAFGIAQPMFLIMPVSPEEWLGFIATVITPWYAWTGSLLIDDVLFRPVSELFPRAVPQNLCIWQTVCEVRIGQRTYQWTDFVPLFEGAMVLFEEQWIDEDLGSTTCSNDTEESVSTETASLETVTTDDNEEDDAAGLWQILTGHIFSVDGVKEANIRGEECNKTTGENTATPVIVQNGRHRPVKDNTATLNCDNLGECPQAQERQDLEEVDYTNLMQRTVATREVVPFEIAAERGLPFT